MWPSKYSFNWNVMDVGPKRDLLGQLKFFFSLLMLCFFFGLGDLANAIRTRTNVTFGLYHSLFEWFNPVFLSDKNNSYSTKIFPTV